MGGCAVPGCYRRRGDVGYTFHKFPSDPARRAKWLQNCGRPNWVPVKSASMCNVHFAENQFELHRADGWKKLKQNAIPTIFPKQEARRRRRRTKKNKSAVASPLKMEEESACLPSQKPAGLRVQLKKRNKRKTTIPARWRGFEIDSMIKRKEDELNQDSALVDDEPQSADNEHQYAKNDLDTAVRMVEVSFSGVKQDEECIQCTQLKDTLFNVIEERDALQKKVHCFNAAIRMVLTKEQRQTLRFVANTISQNWIVPEADDTFQEDLATAE